MQLTIPYIVPEAANGNAIDTPISVTLPVGTHKIKLRGDVVWLTGAAGQINLGLNGTAELTGGFTGEQWSQSGAHQEVSGPVVWEFSVNPTPAGQPARSPIKMDSIVTVTTAGTFLITVNFGGGAWNPQDAVYFDRLFTLDVQPA